MKILYAIQGTGNGHIARAEEIVPFLFSYGKVDLFVSGAQADIQLPFPVRYKSKGLSFYFGKKGGIDFLQTFRKNNTRSVWREIRNFPVEDYDVVINEIMADPSPIVGLPDAEYVEFFNTTNYSISTAGWTFEHGTTIRNFPNAVIPPDSFLVITTSAALNDMSIYGNVVAVANLSSTAITNSGTSLKLGVTDPTLGTIELTFGL